ncbi:MAG TPA: M48 family metalloprotease [Devosiaceae bacterium]|jgi:predicted Zn-dependent protease
MTGSRRFFGGARAGVLGLLLVMISGCTQLFPESDIKVTKSGDNNAPPVTVASNDNSDEAIGMREHPRIIASFGGIYNDRPAEIMLARMVSKLLTAANQPNTNFTITILDSSEVNAFALPGGYVYVTRGILALANDSSELAAVLSHEMAHVILKHARARTNRARTDAIVDRVITGVFGGNSQQVEQQARLSMAAFSQQQELDADHEGILIAGKAGYDPYAASRFLGVMGRFAKFSGGETNTGQDFLSSHPSTPDRIQKAIATAHDSFGAEGTGTRDREVYLDGIDGMAFGPSQEQGAIIGRRFVHPGAKFTFTVPNGYTLQTSQSAVVGVAGDGEAVRFDSANVPTNVSLVDYLKSGWIAGLDANSVTAQSYNGIDMAIGTAKTEQWSFRVSVMRLDGTVYRFIFAAKADSARFAQGAEETLKSFRRASGNDLSQLRKLVIKVVTAKAGDTAAALASRMAGLTKGPDLFYVLNNLLPGDALVTGQQYKIVALN